MNGALPKLSVSSLQAGYGDVQVLWDVGLEVAVGELVCIIGSNGAGKTTLMRCLSGLLKPTAGSITVDGKSMTLAGPADFVRAGIAHVPEGRRLFSAMANGVQASYVEVDCETGFIKVFGQWAVDDCGRIINPLLVDEQVRGGIVQGIGAVLYEECIYGDDANLQNGTMADYLVPMSDAMPDIVVAHIETPEASTKLGAKGIGEAGLIGAMGSVWVAVNDALKPFGAKVLHQPFTPERVLDALARARASGTDGGAT